MRDVLFILNSLGEHSTFSARDSFKFKVRAQVSQLDVNNAVAYLTTSTATP